MAFRLLPWRRPRINVVEMHGLISPRPGAVSMGTWTAVNGRYTVRITTYDDGGPGAGIGYGESFDTAWGDVTELRARRAG